MKVIVLGTSGTYPRYGKACSGYLIEDDPTFVLSDLGTGALSNLFRHLDPFSLTSIILTHLHTDHSLDIYPLRYYLQYNNYGAKKRLPLYLPEGGKEVLQAFNPGKENEGYLENVFEFKKIGEQCTIGSLRFNFMKARHVVPTYSFVCESSQGRRFGYTSDTSWDDGLVEFFKGCTVLVCEAAYQGEEGRDYLHMTALEAGRFAALAGVERLYLTHLWPELDPKKSLEDARKEFGGQVEILKEHLIIEV